MKTIKSQMTSFINHNILYINQKIS